MNGKQQTWRRVAAWVAVLLLLFILCRGLWVTGFFQAARSPLELQDYIRQFAPYSHAVFFLLQLVSVIVAPIPSNLTAAAGGLLFGWWAAFLLTAAAVSLGSAIVFQLSRCLGQPFTRRFVTGKTWERYGQVIRRKRDIFLLLAFLFPFFPDDLLCMMAGLTDISFRRFLLLVALGRPWGLLVSAAVGGSAVSIPWWGMALLGVGGAIIFLLALRYSDRTESFLLRCLDRSSPPNDPNLS